MHRWSEQKLPSLTGKTVAITGTTTGTGYVCAKTWTDLRQEQARAHEGGKAHLLITARS
jgi:NAD(P)-dependent dehydrogenase (short-subunit alcohol dehydrogenase family)